MMYCVASRNESWRTGMRRHGRRPGGAGPAFRVASDPFNPGSRWWGEPVGRRAVVVSCGSWWSGAPREGSLRCRREPGAAWTRVRWVAKGPAYSRGLLVLAAGSNVRAGLS